MCVIMNIVQKLVQRSHRHLPLIRNCHAGKWTYNTHLCGDLNRQHVGEKVTICGWIHHTRLDKFIVLRDHSGLVQVLMQDEKVSVPCLESCVCIEGVVTERPPGQNNPKMSSGEIEVTVESIKSVNSSRNNLPFYIKPFQSQEALRLKHRYLDLRNPSLQKNLRLRSEIVHKMRNFMIDNGFVEVETPTLFRRTPGGAREFLVPTHTPDHFYSLVQSPQQFKQLLMVGGIGRYFQVARCYRDEGSRPDRQPEFTQIDIELSFTDAEKVQELTETLIKASWPTPLPADPFPRITYKEAMEKYGSDKPDLRIDNQIENLGKYPSDGRFVKALWFRADQLKIEISKTALKKFEKEMKKMHENLVIVSMNKDNLVKKVLPEDYELKHGDDQVGFVVLGHQENQVQECLGKIRSRFCEQLVKLEENELRFLWVVDFPLFLQDEEKLESAHHPFTRPIEEDLHLLDSHPELVRGQHYDLVLNGYEIAGGSMRIHESHLQRKVLEDILNEDTSELNHMLEALTYGCPPHGGIALGLDRIMMIICNAQSIRDVIAFPKTLGGKDLMSGSPTTVQDQDKAYYHLLK